MPSEIKPPSIADLSKSGQVGAPDSADGTTLFHIAGQIESRYGQQIRDAADQAGLFVMAVGAFYPNSGQVIGVVVLDSQLGDLDDAVVPADDNQPFPCLDSQRCEDAGLPVNFDGHAVVWYAFPQAKRY